VDTALILKTAGGAVLIGCVMALALTGKIDGPQALDAIKVLGATFIGGAAAISVANRFAKPKIAPPVAITGKENSKS
jgi:hypothetical protein